MQRSTSIGLVVTDLDGTLWETPGTIHPRTRDALDNLDRRGTPLLVATGRRIGSTRAPLAAAGLAPPAVVLNGTLGLDLASGRRFHRGGFTAGQASAVLAAFVTCGVEPCVHIDHDDAPVRVGSSPSTHPRHLESFGHEVRNGALSSVVAEELVLAFGVLGVEQSLAQTLQHRLHPIATTHVDADRQYGGFTVTVAPPAQSKWDGVAAFCAVSSIDPTTVLAIGDGPNDIELLERAGMALVPADAHPDALARADHVVAPASEGGWADLLHHL